jgi:hypothetical protein
MRRSGLLLFQVVWCFYCHAVSKPFLVASVSLWTSRVREDNCVIVEGPLKEYNAVHSLVGISPLLYRKSASFIRRCSLSLMCNRITAHGCSRHRRRWHYFL